MSDDTEDRDDEPGGGGHVAVIEFKPRDQRRGTEVDRSDGADESATGASPDSDGGPDEDSADAAVEAPESVVVHPRMRQRRRQIEDDVVQRRTLRRIWVLGTAALVIDGLAVAHTPLLDVDRVVIEPSQHATAATLAWASQIDRGEPLLTLDEGAAEDRIERLPWVAEADVVRSWSGTVRINVRERQPAAAVETDRNDPAAVVDAEGRVLDITRLVPPGLVMVTGLDAELAEGEPLPRRARDALRIALDVSRRVPGAVASVSTDLEATLTNGGVVIFGSAEKLQEKLVALATVLSRVNLANVTTIDLRVPDHPAIARH